MTDRILELYQSGAEVLKSPAFQLAMTAIKAEYIEEFGKTKLFNGEAHREKLWATMNTVNELERRLENMLSDGRALLKLEERPNRAVRGE